MSGHVRTGFGDSGGASRFFPTFRYQAKAPTSERPKVDGVAHPTVKPLALMRWLVRLVTPPGGVVLDPFAGSGATLEAAALEGFDSIGIEREADYLPLIGIRCERVGVVAEVVRPTGPEVVEEEVAEVVPVDPIMDAIATAPTYAALLALHKASGGAGWEQCHLDAAKARKAQVPAA